MSNYQKGQLGLVNVGNSCFLNSTVQCLAGTDGLRTYFNQKYQLKSGQEVLRFQKDLEAPKTKKNNKTESKKTLTTYWYYLLKKLWTDPREIPTDQLPLNPYPFYQQLSKVAIESKKELALNGTQNDFQEFLILLLESLHDSLSRETTMSIIGSDQNDMDRIDRMSYDNYITHFEKDMSILVELFAGQIYNRLAGVECGHVSESCDPIQFFPLVVPNSMTSVPLEDLLRDYTSEEILDGDEKWYCEECQQKVKATKKTSIWRLPPYLIISLGRCQYHPTLHKRNTLIEYPLNGLDMTPYYSGFESNSLKYDLYAVGLHLGSNNPYMGHYLGLRKNPDGNWYNFNDQSVSQISPSSVVHRGAYCLFYKRSDL